MKDLYCFKDTSQVSKISSYNFSLPKYGKSTTDPTYYEPQATRIANMRKSASSMKTLYDFENDDVSKFKDAENALKNIGSARLDPRFNNFLTREEISQVTTDLGYQAQEIVSDKKQKNKKKVEDINDALTLKNVIENTTQNNNTNEE